MQQPRAPLAPGAKLIYRACTTSILRKPRVQSLSIGSIKLPNPVLLAPMTGITDAPFRRQAAALGAGLVISEMTACAALASDEHKGKHVARRRIADHGAGLHVVQLAGCEAYWMAEGTRIAEDSGASVIDINMGCPAKN